ncbi:hypothetical protein GOODEAATRI_028815, partial [Goodea atripinnis]
LMVILCPNSGYTVQYLKNPQSQIGNATIFIRPLQRNLNPNPIILDKITWPTHDDEEDIEVSLEDTCRVSGFLRTFIEN